MDYLILVGFCVSIGASTLSLWTPNEEQSELLADLHAALRDGARMTVEEFCAFCKMPDFNCLAQLPMGFWRELMVRRGLRVLRAHGGKGGPAER